MPQLPDRFNAAEFFVDRNLAGGGGSRTAVHFGHESLTYEEVADLVWRGAAAFRECDVSPDDRVLILLEDSPAFAAAFWGAIRLGAIAVPLNTYLSADDYAFMLADSDPRCLVVEEHLLEKVLTAAGQPTEPDGTRPETAGGQGGGYSRTILIAGGDSHLGQRSADLPGASKFPEVAGGWRLRDLEMALAQSQPEGSATATHADDPAFWLYTSGSTGRPKAAIHQYGDMAVCFENYAKGVLEITAEDRVFSASKLFFAYGLGNALYFPAGAGAETILLRERATVERVRQILEHYRPTLFYAVPSLYAGLLELTDAPRSLWSSVRCAVSAGEALPAALWHRFRERFGIEILDGIGSTEMLHIFISNRAGKVEPGSSGTLVPGYEARIVDDEGREVDAGGMGNLWVRGESAAAGYWNRPELTRETFRGEWTLTGDKYRRDEHGNFWHCGRSDDMMKVQGLWVSPLEIESALIAHPAVVECAVVGAIDNVGLTGLKAFVVLKESASPSPALLDDVQRHLEACLPRYKVPRWLVPVESLPKTTTGKVQRFRLRQLGESTLSIATH